MPAAAVEQASDASAATLWKEERRQHADALRHADAFVTFHPSAELTRHATAPASRLFAFAERLRRCARKRRTSPPRCRTARLAPRMHAAARDERTSRHVAAYDMPMLPRVAPAVAPSNGGDGVCATHRPQHRLSRCCRRDMPRRETTSC